MKFLTKALVTLMICLIPANTATANIEPVSTKECITLNPKERYSVGLVNPRAFVLIDRFKIPRYGIILALPVLSLRQDIKLTLTRPIICTGDGDAVFINDNPIRVFSVITIDIKDYKRKDGEWDVKKDKEPGANAVSK